MEQPDIIAHILATLAPSSGRWDHPVLVGILGLPGTGKTATAHWLAARYPFVVLSTDALRLRYRLASGPATHELIYAAIAALLPAPVGIILDGLHLGRADRLHLRQFAAQHRAHCAILHTTAPPDIIAARLRARQEDGRRTAAEGKFVVTPAHLARIAGYLEAPAVDEAIWELDTSTGNLEAQCAPLLAQLDEWRHAGDGPT